MTLDRLACLFIFALAALIVAGCGGGSTATTHPPAPVAPAEINLLFMGNSHTSFNNLPGMVAAMVRVAGPGAP